MSGSTTQVVSFDYATWAAEFPELSPSINSVQAQNYFTFACLYVDNSACSIILDASQPGGVRETILYMTLSHIATLLALVNGVAPSPLVGRISGASQGSVSVATEMPTNPNAAWWMQTKYGALAWAALAPFRTATYFPNPRPYGAFGALGFPGAGGFPWLR